MSENKEIIKDFSEIVNKRKKTIELKRLLKQARIFESKKKIIEKLNSEIAFLERLKK